MAFWSHRDGVRVWSCFLRRAEGAAVSLSPATSLGLETDDWRWRVRVAFGAWKFLLHAWFIKTRSSLSGMALPLLSGRVGGISGKRLSCLVERTDQTVRWGARCTGRKCFFRAYILGALLRQQGVPAVMNVGLREPGPGESGRRVDGHCWVSVAGMVLAECRQPELTYPVFLGESRHGIRYWSGHWQQEQVPVSSGRSWSAEHRLGRFPAALPTSRAGARRSVSWPGDRYKRNQPLPMNRGGDSLAPHSQDPMVLGCGDKLSPPRSWFQWVSNFGGFPGTNGPPKKAPEKP